MRVVSVPGPAINGNAIGTIEANLSYEESNKQFPKGSSSCCTDGCSDICCMVSL